MTRDERIITFIRRSHEAYIDGNIRKKMIEETKETGLT
jgi:hypothetical protein